MNKTGQRQGGVIHKTDVSQAFNNMLLHPDTALLQAFQVNNHVIIPVVSDFGWAGAPAHYNIIAEAIHWAHNGGVTIAQLDKWTLEQKEEVVPLPSNQVEWQIKDRSITYVDDSIAQSSAQSEKRDQADLKTIIKALMGETAYNKDKTTEPDRDTIALGWHCQINNATIRPSPRGMAKIYYWIFRGWNLNTYLSIASKKLLVTTMV